MASKKVFIDSSALYAFVDRADPNHMQSAKIIEQFSLVGMQLSTSILSVQETYSAINRQLGNTLSLDFLTAILDSNIEILYPQKADLSAAAKLIKLNQGKQVNLREALTAVLMQKRGVNQILTFTYWHNLLGSTPYLFKL